MKLSYRFGRVFLAGTVLVLFLSTFCVKALGAKEEPLYYDASFQAQYHVLYGAGGGSAVITDETGVARSASAGAGSGVGPASMIGARTSLKLIPGKTYKLTLNVTGSPIVIPGFPSSSFYARLEVRFSSSVNIYVNGRKSTMLLISTPAAPGGSRTEVYDIMVGEPGGVPNGGRAGVPKRRRLYLNCQRQADLVSRPRPYAQWGSRRFDRVSTG